MAMSEDSFAGETDRGYLKAAEVRFRGRFWRWLALTISIAAAGTNAAAVIVLFAHGNPMGVMNLAFLAGTPILYRAMTF